MIEFMVAPINLNTLYKEVYFIHELIKWLSYCFQSFSLF